MLVAQSCLTPYDPAKLLSPRDFPGKNSEVGCHSLLQGNLSNQGIKPMSFISPALAGRFFTTNAIWEATLFMEILSLHA